MGPIARSLGAAGRAAHGRVTRIDGQRRAPVGARGGGAVSASALTEPFRGRRKGGEGICRGKSQSDGVRQRAL